MRQHGRRKPITRRRRVSRRPFLIDAEDFDFMDDYEMHDWMFGCPADVASSSKF